MGCCGLWEYDPDKLSFEVRIQQCVLEGIVGIEKERKRESGFMSKRKREAMGREECKKLSTWVHQNIKTV